jgi:hypothetical protein
MESLFPAMDEGLFAEAAPIPLGRELLPDLRIIVEEIFADLG